MIKQRVSTNHASYLTNQPVFRRKTIVTKIVAGSMIFWITSCNFSFMQNEKWFPFKPNNDAAESVTDMSAWLDKPAGKHGFVKYDSSDYYFEDGTSAKFWGVNICSQRPYSDKDSVDKWSRYLSRHGINAVRFHKYTSHGLSQESSTRMDPDKIDKMDYFQFRLRESGIYYGWSPIYGHKVKPGDSLKLLAYSEIASADLGSHLSYSTIGLVNFADDIQDLHIELFKNLLNHKNPYTGLKYAEDPALCFIEIQNEDDIFFGTTDQILKKCPSYKKLLTKKFTQWLREKYGSQAKLFNAWGNEAFEWGREIYQTDWDLDKSNICPVCSHGIYSYEYEKALQNNEALPLFLSDMAYFLYQEQNRYYSRLLTAIRETGYKGPVISSCWQAGSGISHFYNLHSDFLTGPIDRHNYFGGGTGHKLVPGAFRNEAMVSNPGSGLLNTGKQSVKDRPFQFSEWLSLMPNEWIAEGPPLVAIYGMGLQGWDASYAFASDFTGFTSTLHTPGVYNINTPSQIGLYPALSAIIYRNEIEQGKFVCKRHVSIKELKEGVLGFETNVSQDWDQKSFSGGCPNEFLAAGQIAIEFSDSLQETVIPDITEYVDTLNKTIQSVTGQLFWDYSENGYFTANTQYSKVITGFCKNKVHDFDNVKMSTSNDFVVAILTSLDKEKDLNTTNRALLSLVARTRNSNMQFNDEMTEITNPGTSPVLIEPVNMQIRFDKRRIKEVYFLDHSGCRTRDHQFINSKNFFFNGSKHKTMYCELILE